MLSLRHRTKLCVAIVVAAIMLTGALSLSYAETGSVRLISSTPDSSLASAAAPVL